MFGAGFSNRSIKDVMSRCSEEDILLRYFDIKKLPCKIKSPLRADDNPSFAIFKKNNKIWYKDFSTSEHGGIIDLLMKTWNCSQERVYDRLRNDFKCARTRTDSSMTYERETPITLSCKTREWQDYDIEYWRSYGINLDALKRANVYPISHKFIDKNNNRLTFIADKYAYAYIENKENKLSMKIYQPFNKDGYKWNNDHDRSVISLWNMMPLTGESIVICSSVKDALCLYCNTGLPAIALQGEGYGISKTAQEELRRRFRNVYICFDSDKAGVEDSAKLAEDTGFTNIPLPYFEGAKDISDIYKKIGVEKFKSVFDDLFSCV